MSYTYCSLDIESSGLDTTNDQVLEIAIVVDDLSQSVSREDLEDYLSKLPVFHCYVKHDRIQGHPYAISMHNRIFNIIAKEPLTFRGKLKSELDISNLRNKEYLVLSPEQVYETLGEWLDWHDMLHGNKITAAGKNLGSFDFRILETLPGFKNPNRFKFYHKYIDVGPLYLKPTDTEPPSLDECLQRAGINKAVDHTAVGDAMDTIRCLKLSKLYN